MPDDKDRIREFVEPGSEIAGNVAGAAIGLMTAGPVGALAGAACGPVITSVFKRTCLELYDRVTSKREKIRAGAAAAYALTQIDERIQQGEQLRDDGFFEATLPGLRLTRFSKVSSSRAGTNTKKGRRSTMRISLRPQLSTLGFRPQP